MCHISKTVGYTAKVTFNLKYHTQRGLLSRRQQSKSTAGNQATERRQWSSDDCDATAVTDETSEVLSDRHTKTSCSYQGCSISTFCFSCCSSGAYRWSHRPTLFVSTVFTPRRRRHRSVLCRTPPRGRRRPARHCSTVPWTVPSTAQPVTASATRNHSKSARSLCRRSTVSR